MNQLWCKDTRDDLTGENQGYTIRQEYIIKTGKGSFSFAYPLKDLFGFSDDYERIIYGFKHSLILKRTSNSDAIIADAAVPLGKVTITKLMWMMPHVMPDDSEKLSLMKTIESKDLIPLAFRERRCETISVPQTKSFNWTLPAQSAPNFPRKVILGFQTARDKDQK